MISFSFIAHHQGGSRPVAFKANVAEGEEEEEGEKEGREAREAREARGPSGIRKSARRLSLLDRAVRPAAAGHGRAGKGSSEGFERGVRAAREVSPTIFQGGEKTRLDGKSSPPRSRSPNILFLLTVTSASQRFAAVGTMGDFCPKGCRLFY